MIVKPVRAAGEDVQQATAAVLHSGKGRAHRGSCVLTKAGIVCPYCWNTCEMTVDCSAGEQRYIEDCPVCSHPIERSAR